MGKRNSILEYLENRFSDLKHNVYHRVYDEGLYEDCDGRTVFYPMESYIFFNPYRFSEIQKLFDIEHHELKSIVLFFIHNKYGYRDKKHLSTGDHKQYYVTRGLHL